MKLRLAPLALVVGILTSFVSAQQSDRASVMFEAARRTAVVDGNLPGAIKQYEAIIKTFPNDRAVKAQALLQMAECYQKLGDAQARKIYEDLVRDYADQKEAAATARTRLGGPAKTTQPVDRQVWAGKGVPRVVAVSPDGRYVAFPEDASEKVDNTANLILRDLATGTERAVTAAAVDDFAGTPAFSKDGKQLGFSWYDNKAQRTELRAIELRTTGIAQPRIARITDLTQLRVFDWMPDGKRVAVELQRTPVTSKSTGYEIGIVNLDDGSFQVLASPNWRARGSRLAVSPDGASLAYSAPSDDSVQHDVFVVSTRDGRQAGSIAGPTSEKVVGWTPDGRHLLYSSEERGTMSVRAQLMVGGRPDGESTVLRAIVPGDPLGVTISGALLLSVPTADDAIHTATVDLSTGKVIEPPVRLAAGVWPWNRHPKWSADGKSFAYLSARNAAGGAAAASILTIQSAGSEPRSLQLKLAWLRSFEWSPDGRTFLARAMDLKGQEGIYRIDAQTGEVAPVVLNQGGSRNLLPQWADSGSKIYYVRTEAVDTMLLERDLTSGNEREIVRQRHGELPRVAGAAFQPAAASSPGLRMGHLRVSPDRRYVAAVSRTGTEGVIWAISLTDGHAREVFRFRSGPIYLPFYDSPVWTADSRAIFMSEEVNGNPRALWVVPLEGEPRKIDVGNRNMWQEPVAVHPDGRQIAFVAGNDTSYEIRVLENLLPGPKR